MYIKTTRSKGYEYLYLVEDVYEGGRKKTVLIERLGRADLLSPEDIQSIRAREVNGKKYTMAAIGLNSGGIMSMLQRQTSQQQPSEALEQGVDQTDGAEDNSEIDSLHYGHLLVKQIWIHTLGLHRRIMDLQSEELPKLTFQLSSMGYFLCAARMMSPSSYLGVFNQNDCFLANPISSVNLVSIYRSLVYFGRFKDQIMKAAYTNLSRNLGLSKPKLLFFDCTNFYFETPYDSKEELIISLHRKRYLKLINEGASQDAIQEHLKSQEFANELSRAVEDAEKNGLLTRMRGPSKEKRYDQPLMGMSLVIDDHGFPLDFELFPGNKSEFGYLRRAVAAIKEKYGITDAFYVADRGLNSGQNLKFIQLNLLGFIVAQKVSQLSKSQRADMLAADGWKTIDLTKDLWAVQLVDDIDGAQYRYKVCDYVKTYYETVEDANGETKRKVEVKCKIIYTFSEKRKRRDLCVIDAMVSRAKAEIEAGKFASNACSTGWRSLLRTNADKNKKKKGQDKEQYRYTEVDEEKISKLKEIAGYAALVYSAPAGYQVADDRPEALELTAQKGYKQLVSIEDCFRTAKSTLNLRPVFLKRDDRTLGHCLFCVLSLLMLKVIQYNLKQAGINMSLAKIQQALNQAMVAVVPSPLTEGKALYFTLRSSKLDVPQERKLGKSGTQMPPQIRSITALVVKAVGLAPLKAIELERDLRLKLKVDPRIPLLSANQLAYLQQLSSQIYQ